MNHILMFIFVFKYIYAFKGVIFKIFIFILCAQMFAYVYVLHECLLQQRREESIECPGARVTDCWQCWELNSKPLFSAIFNSFVLPNMKHIAKNFF